ncbi:hypothetical protein MUK42_37294, partial [Musa troglodytarum]
TLWDPQGAALTSNRKVSFLSIGLLSVFASRKRDPAIDHLSSVGWKFRPSGMGRRRNVGLWKRAPRVPQKKMEKETLGAYESSSSSDDEFVPGLENKKQIQVQFGSVLSLAGQEAKTLVC